jgi:hypothetical protein
MWRTLVLALVLAGCAGNAAAPDGSGGLGGTGGIAGTGGTGGTGGMPDADPCSAVTQCGPQDGCCALGCSAATDPDCSPSCGNGIVEPGEQCDKGIPAGQPGACPTGCDDGDPCTTETMQGSPENCTARCVRRQVTDCGRDDGCCPSGCNATNDPNCVPTCGNGVIEAGETCDPPSSCPTNCDDGNACTHDVATGSAAQCNVRCQHTAITACGASDGCCPAGCNANNDPDCQPSCGNGVIEPGEACDPPSSCPTSCNDGNACTADQLFGSAANCTATCGHTPITACGPNDGCCPAGCGSGQDPNCQTAVCGNGVVEAGETCDTAIAQGQPGACPTSCNDGNACTIDALTGSGCSKQCTHTAVTTCSLASDGCCPAGCNANNDADCTPRCGNGVVEAGETCDPPGSCPTLASCNDGNACTTDLLVGSANTCTAQCAHGAVTQCSFSSDGCCPSGCNFNNDIDCPEVCGNGVVEGSELCDTGIPAGQTGACPTSCAPTGITCEASQLAGTGCQAHCTSATAITSCSAGDQCCPFGCTMSSDADCFGTWTPSTLASNVAFTTTCTNVPVPLVANHHYVVTTCVASGTAIAGSGDTVLEVRDPSNNLVVQDDDCITTPNLVVSAGWSCVNGSGNNFASCAGETPGGFNAPVTGTYQVCVRAFSSTSTGTATVTLWSN